MLITYFRSSSLANLDFCEAQYFLNYVLGIPRKAGLKAALGTTVHKVLECLASLKKEQQEGGKGPFAIDDAAVGPIQVKLADFHGKDLVNELIQKAFDHYSKENNGCFSKADFNSVEKWTYNALWYQNGLFDPRQRHIVDAEPHFDIPILKDWAKYHYKIGMTELKGTLAIKGTVDLITKIGDKTIEIIDWKTGERKNWATGEEKTYEKLCQDPQLMLYYYAAKQMYPWVEDVVVTIFFLRDGKYKGGPFTVCFEPKHIIQMEEILRDKFEYVKRNKKPSMVSPNQTDFKCTRICDYYKNKWPGTNMNMCRFIQEKIKKHGIEYVEENFKAEGHNIGHYTNPGE